MTELIQAIELFEDEFDLDDINTSELSRLIEMLKKADDPNYESYINLIDEEVEELETKLEDMKQGLEPIRKILLGVDEDDE